MRILSENIISAPTSLATAWTSEPLWLGHVYMYAIQMTFSGPVQGTFKLQCSSDIGQNTASRSFMGTGITNWTDILGSDQSITSAGDHTWDVAEIGYRWVRIVWTPTAASGMLNTAIFSTKGQ